MGDRRSSILVLANKSRLNRFLLFLRNASPVRKCCSLILRLVEKKQKTKIEDILPLALLLSSRQYLFPFPGEGIDYVGCE